MDDHEYEPIGYSNSTLADENVCVSEDEHDVPFSWLEYAVFMLLGVAMLWAWFVLPSPTTQLPKSTNMIKEYVLGSGTIFPETLRRR